MTCDSNCRCDCFVHPRVITNPPRRDQLAYRVGDYTSFRHALLLSLPGETELVNWKPAGTSDLALQMVEWWAYIADILTFYNERIAERRLPAHTRFLMKASRPHHPAVAARYWPRPGLGARYRCFLAALTNAKNHSPCRKGYKRKQTRSERQATDFRGLMPIPSAAAR